jgi:competence protein ComEC
MMEAITLLLLFGALLYRTGIGLLAIGIMSALTSAFFFTYFLSRKSLITGMCIGGIIFIGAFVMRVHEISVPHDFFISRTVTGIVQTVDQRIDKTLLVIKDSQYQKNIQVTVHSKNNFLPGDTVQAYGAIQIPTDFMTDTGRMFSYQAYMQSKNIMAVMPSASLHFVLQGNFSIVRFATIVRFHIAAILTRYISFPIDGLVAGILVGYQGGIPSAMQDLFRTTGVLHVVVLSGENITLLAVFLAMLLRPLPFHIRSILTACAIVLVVLISGAGVSAIRAGIMGIIALSAGMVRRNYIPFRALTISILFFFFYSPETIFVDPGFHLSVLATIFMIIVVPKIELLFSYLPEKYAIRELAMLALCVPIFMLPYTMYFSGLVPLASPFANILMAIVTPLMMLLGATVLAISWIIPVAQVAGILVSWIGNIVISILTVLNKLPQLNAPPLAWWGVIGSYFLFFSIVFRFELRQFLYERRTYFLPPSNSSEPESH